MTAPYASYFKFWDSFTAAVSHALVPLEWIPVLTTLAALLAQLIPYAIILFGRLVIAHRLTDRIALCIILILTPLSDENWLTVTNSQFHFSMGAALLLFEFNRKTHHHERWKRLYLLAGGLTSVATCMLAPVYLLAGWLRKDRTTLHRGFLLTACAVFQVGVLCLVYFYPHADISTVSYAAPSSREFPSPAMLGGVLWAQTVGLTFAGKDLCILSTRYLLWAIDSGSSMKFTAYGMIFLAGSIGLAAAVMRLASRRYWATLFLSFLVLAVIPSIAGIGPKWHYLNFGWNQRYYYVPNALLLISAWFAFRSHLKGSIMIRYGLLWCLCAGLFTGIAQWKYTYGLPNRPDWREEVSKWRADCTYRPKVWGPGVNFEVFLDCPGNTDHSHPK